MFHAKATEALNPETDLQAEYKRFVPSLKINDDFNERAGCRSSVCLSPAFDTREKGREREREISAKKTNLIALQ